MSTLQFAETYNMIAFLEKPVESNGFQEIIDFLMPINIIKCFKTVNPTIYIILHCTVLGNQQRQKTVNGERQLQALVDKKEELASDKEDASNREGVLKTLNKDAKVSLVDETQTQWKSKLVEKQGHSAKFDEERTTTSSLQASQPSKTKDKGKAIMIEPEVPLKKKDQVALDEEMARNLEAQLQAKLIEEERLA
ncbi:hypothetical protein Tco_0794094 [Tanacetum coccineum]